MFSPLVPALGLTMFLLVRARFLVRLIASLSANDLRLDVLMRLQRVAALSAFLLAFLTPCFAHHMAVVVNKDNDVANITASHLTSILRSEIKKWPDGKAVILVLHKDSPGETETLERLIKLNGEGLKAMVAAHKDSVVLVDSDADVLKTVQTTPGAIGLVDVRSVDNSINVVRVDGKLPMESGYLPH
jgi:ABC-type phosphate transport system substrate-binding protein